MNYFIFQGNEHDCGFASLKMLLATLANDKSYLYISKPEKKENFSLKDLQVIASEFDVFLEASKCDIEYLDLLICPCLAIVNSNHCVMIKKRTKNRFLVFDPGTGIKWISKKKFINIFSRNIVEVLPATKIQKIKRIRKSILPRKMHFFQTIISFVSVIALMTSFYFLNTAKNFIFSLAFIALFSISQLIENLYLHKQINYFDETYIPLYFERKEKRDKNGYEKFLNYKRNYFLTNRSLLSSVLLAFSVTFLLCFNDFRNILALLIIVLLKLLDLVISNKPNKKIIERIEKYEELGIYNNEENVHNLIRANRCANDKVFVDSLKNVLFMLLCFGLALLMMVITGNSGCNFVIFHFAIYFVGYKTYSDMLLSVSNSKNTRKNEAQFLDECNL